MAAMAALAGQIRLLGEMARLRAVVVADQNKPIQARARQVDAS
jgi:hypothetical protein